MRCLASWPRYTIVNGMGGANGVDTNLLSSLLSSMVNQASGYLGRASFRIMGNRHPSITPYETFDTADRPIAVAVGNDKQFAAVAAELGVQEILSDNRFGTNDRVANRMRCAPSSVRCS